MGERKRKKQHIIRFTSEVDELLMQIGNKTFYSASKEYKEETIQSLANLWLKACKEGKAVYSRLLRDNNENETQSVNAIIPFGPWISWKKEDWEDVDYKYSAWKRDTNEMNILNQNHQKNQIQ